MAEVPPSPRPLILGLGSEDRGDDRVGPEVCRALRARGPLPADVREGPGDLTELFDLWAGRTFVVLVDAVRTGAPVGTLHRWNGRDAERWPVGSGVSTHGFSLAQVLHLARGLGRLPPRVAVFGIEIGTLGPGPTLTPAVLDAVPRACRAIEEELVRDVDRTAPLGGRTNAHA